MLPRRTAIAAAVLLSLFAASDCSREPGPAAPDVPDVPDVPPRLTSTANVVLPPCDPELTRKLEAVAKVRCFGRRYPEEIVIVLRPASK